MSYVNPDSEDAAVEQPTIALFAELGWETLNCYHETFRAAVACSAGKQWPKSCSPIVSVPPSRN